MAEDNQTLPPQEQPEPDLSHLFKHLVTLEVSYESLAHATRVALHGRYARYLQREADLAAARDMMDRPEEEAGSVLSTAKSYLALYRDPVVARNVSRSE